MQINMNRRLSTKIVDCVFLRYTHYSITYKFLVIKSVIPDIHVDTFLEFRDIIFFENIFPIKNAYDMFSLPANVIADTSPKPFENCDHAEHTPESNS
jgi:hypothetical protein